MRRRWNNTIKLMPLLGIVCFAAGALGALPDNDNFAVRIPLAGTSVSTTGSNIGATREIGEPDPNFTGGRSVWWTWTAPSAGYVTITTAGSSFDTMLTVFTGTSLSNLTLVAFNDTEGETSTVSFNVTAGTAYQIAVDGTDNELAEVNNAVGNISLQLTLGPVQAPPVNDNFANRITISGSHINNVIGSNVGATSEPGEPFHADAIGEKSVWWTWTAPASGGLILNSHGSAIDTVMAVYTGNSVGSLTLVAANDEDPDFGSESTVTCNVVGGNTYQIAVDGFEGETGDTKFSLDLEAAFPVPANNNFANRIPLTGSSITTNVSNVGATYEAGEPMHLAIFGGKTVWFRWTAPSSGGVTLTVSNNALDTLVAVYTGTSLGNLNFVAGNDEDYFLSEFLDGDSTAYFNAVNGTTYVIAVDGVDGNWGPFQLRLTLGAADSVPANNNFANSVLISGTNTTVNGSNLGATLESGEPLHRGYYGGSSVWWRWVSPGPGIVTIDTSNNIVDTPDTLLAVYTGASVSTLTEVASDNNSGGANWTSMVSFPTKSNVTYRIAVDGYDGDAWSNIKVRVRFGLASYSLTVVTNPAGAGTVNLNPLPDQGGKYAPGSIVTMTANPAAGNTFTGWNGNVSSTNNPLVIVMNSNLTVSADFLVQSTTTKTWTGASPSSGNWTDSQNWNGTPVAGDNLIFPPGALRRSGNTNDFPANTIFSSVTLGGDDYILRGNAVSLTGGLVATNATATNTVQLAVQLSGSQSFRCDNANGALLISGNVNLGAHTLTADSTGNIIVSGVISGSGALVKTSPGTLRLAGNSANTYTGSTTVNQGTLALSKAGAIAVPGTLIIGDGAGGADADVLRLDAAQQIPVGAAITVNSSGLLNLNNVSATLASVLGSGHVEFGGASAVLTVGANNSTSTFNSLISGTGQLIKTGNGTITLTANNTYTGLTTVSNGTLVVNGTQAGSAVVVNSPAVLGGTGRVGNVSGSGTVSPGTSPGIFLSGNATFSANTTFRVELNGTTAGTGYDQLNVSGTVSLAGVLNTTLGFTPAINDSFTIIDNNGNDAVVGTFNNLPHNGHIVFGSVLLQISYNSGAGANNVVLTRVAPAPPTITTLALQASSAQIQGNGQAGLNYILESAPSLAPPISWTAISTNTVDTNGVFQFTHTNALTLPVRFYRVRVP